MSLAILTLLRPQQWLKNLMLLFPPFLGGGIFTPAVWSQAWVPLCAFCLASSFTYIVNDIADLERDRLHPRKKNRPLACGTISVPLGQCLAGLLLVVAFCLAYWVSKAFVAWVAAYLALSVGYSFYFKQVPLLDIFAIASGFVVRLFAGGEAFTTPVSDWLFLSVLLLALFLSSGKRLAEKKLLGECSGRHRQVLAAYPAGFLEGIMFVCASSVLVTYTMYAISKQTLIYSVPLCAYGLFRFMFCILQGEQSDPTEALLRDRHLLVVALIWVVMVFGGVYGA